MTFFGVDVRNGVPVGLGSTAAFGRRGFTPASLFAQGEPGAWYDASDLGTMFTDSAGTTPVTAVEQAVGLILDKSRGVAIGPELITNGDFSSGTGWTAGVNWAIGSGVATATASSGTLVGSSYPVVAGRTYRVEFDVVTITGGTLFVRVGQGTATTFTTTGRKSAILSATNTTGVEFYGGTVSCSIDNISVRELSGTHAIQATAASRPVLRNRHNRLTYSEQFDNADWQKVSAGTGSAPVVTANAATAPDGTTTADQIVFNRGAGNAVGDQSYIVQTPTLISATYTQYIWLKAATAGEVGKQLALRGAAGSGYGVVTLTADWVRYTRTETGASGNWELNNRGTITADNTVTAFVWGADLRSANDTIYPYQRIEAATVYDSDTSKFPLYLACDGSDDSLYTAANLDLSSTDKVTVFAGVTKLSDAAQAAVVELSATVASNNGTFLLAAPDAASATIGWDSKGTAQVDAVASSRVAAPVTAVLTGIGDISGDSAILRVNGAVADTNTGDQGTGNFGSYPLYIGRRNNATLPFNGRLYQLIVRGAASSAAEISSTERWIAGKQGRSL